MNKPFIFLFLLSLCIGCGSESSLTDEQIELHTTQGTEIAEASTKALETKLKTALKAGGVQEAIGFCNVIALPITDSLSSLHNAVIKRTSLKLRNPQNAPDSMELVLLKVYKQMSRMRNPVLVPKILEKNDAEIQFFAPIMIKSETCLKCHGILNQTLNKEDYALIKKHYPNDEAIDYRKDKFRGMWSITLKR